MVKAPTKTPIEFHTDQEPLEKEKRHDDGKVEPLHIYDCPFCQKEQHLFYFPETTTWDCKVCGKKGNVYTFLQYLYNNVCNKQIDYLVSKWGMPKRVFSTIRYNPLNGTYVIPTFRNAKLNNLYKYVDEPVNKIFGTPGLPGTLFDWSDDSHDEVWICEGQKDKLAAEAIIGAREVTAIGIPGANTFKESWSSAFQGKRVVIITDNDNAGEEGAAKILATFRQSALKPKQIFKVMWPESAPAGFDLRDHYNKFKSSSWTELLPLVEEVRDEDLVKVSSETVIADPTCDSYDKALDAFSSAFHMTKDMRAALALTMASIYSIKLEGEQLWLKVIGAPGCGKTRIAKAVSASDYVVNKSTFKGLFSGWKDGDNKDPGLIPEIEGRTLVIKDADALLRQPNIEQIMSELRDFYDKDSSVTYRNRQSYNYQNIRSTFIMLGTQVLRRADHSFLGERLLTIEMDVTPTDEEAIKHKMIERSIQVALGVKDDPETAIMASMKGWIDHLRERELQMTPKDFPEDYKQQIMSLCSLAALMRTQVDRDMRNRLRSPAVPEIPTRLIGQIVTASLALCAVFAENRPTEDIYQIVKKSLKDTINPRSHRYKIVDTILENPAIPAVEIMEATGLDKNTVYEELKDLEELNFVKVTGISGSQPGRKIRAYLLDDKIRVPFKEIVG